MLVKALLVAALGAATLVAAAPPAFSATGDVTCTNGAFSGTARNVTVSGEDGCDLSGATITHNLIIGSETGAFAEGLTVGHDVVLLGADGVELGGATIGHDLTVGPGGGIHLERTTIGHDLVATAPDTVQTGGNAPDSPGGPVRVGHDVFITGTPEGNDFVFDGMCELTVDHDFTMTERSVTLGVGFGDNCAFLGESPNTVGHDLVFTNNSALDGFFGPSALEVGGNRVGHDLIFTGNTAATGGFLEVSDNVVGHDAICANNSPAVGSPEPWDGPNTVGGTNTCD
jgi:hypothetical protein